MADRIYAQEVAAEVRAEMARRGRSIADLASVLGVAAPTARRRYNGETAFDLDEVAVVAKWLGLDLASLLLVDEEVA